MDGIQDQTEIFVCPTDERPLRNVYVTRTKPFGFGNVSNNYMGFGYQIRLQKYRQWQKKPAANKRGPMRIASPSESGAAVVDMSYRGSCDTIETVNAPGSFNNTQTVNRARKTTGWSKPAKVIILVEGRGKEE